MEENNPLPDSTDTSPTSPNIESPPRSPKADTTNTDISKVGASKESNNPGEQAQRVPDSAPSSSSSPNKIKVLFKHVGDAPVINKTKWAVESYRTVSDTILFLRKYLKTDPSKSIFIYVNQSFAPALDQTLQNLYDCYESDKKLVLHYAYTQAWG